MIYKMTSPIPLHVRGVFELPACIWANEVYLVGDFNNWNETATPFHQMRNGGWRVALDLPFAQRFEFRYHMGEQWYTDYHADGIAPSPYCTIRSIALTRFTQKRLLPLLSSIVPSPAGGTKPRCTASSAACVRLVTPNFWKISLRRLPTVFSAR